MTTETVPMLELTSADVADLSDAAAIRERLTDCVVQSQPIHFEEELSFPSGIVWAQSIYSPIRDATGRIYRVVGTAIDVIERKQQELYQIRVIDPSHVILSEAE